MSPIRKMILDKMKARREHMQGIVASMIENGNSPDDIKAELNDLSDAHRMVNRLEAGVPFDSIIGLLTALDEMDDNGE